MIFSKRHLVEESLTLDNAIKIAIVMETAAHDVSELAPQQQKHGASGAGYVHRLEPKVQSRHSTPRHTASGSTAAHQTASAGVPDTSCFRCRSAGHTPKDCRFKNAHYRYCNIKGQIQCVCHKRPNADVWPKEGKPANTKGFDKHERFSAGKMR